jgi:hypothetical protein
VTPHSCSLVPGSFAALQHSNILQHEQTNILRTLLPEFSVCHHQDLCTCQDRVRAGVRTRLPHALLQLGVVQEILY